MGNGVGHPRTGRTAHHHRDDMVILGQCRPSGTTQGRADRRTAGGRGRAPGVVTGVVVDEVVARRSARGGAPRQQCHACNGEVSGALQGGLEAVGPRCFRPWRGLDTARARSRGSRQSTTTSNGLRVSTRRRFGWGRWPGGGTRAGCFDCLPWRLTTMLPDICYCVRPLGAGAGQDLLLPPVERVAAAGPRAGGEDQIRAETAAPAGPFARAP